MRGVADLRSSILGGVSMVTEERRGKKMEEMGHIQCSLYTLKRRNG